MELTVRLRRWGYRMAYVALRAYWFVARPQTSGVKCVITDGDRVLLVRHTYGSRAWELPGGAVKSGEPPDLTARREMQEELGIDIDHWHPLGEVDLAIDHRQDRIHAYHAEVHSPELELDLGELSDAHWFGRAELPDVGPYTQRILVLLADAT